MRLKSQAHRPESFCNTQIHSAISLEQCSLWGTQVNHMCTLPLHTLPLRRSNSYTITRLAHLLSRNFYSVQMQKDAFYHSCSSVVFLLETNQNSQLEKTLNSPQTLSQPIKSRTKKSLYNPN